jgi:hypothetical protein
MREEAFAPRMVCITTIGKYSGSVRVIAVFAMTMFDCAEPGRSTR